EKMTYDNAQIMGLYARAASLMGPGSLGDHLLAAARSTADWFLGEMRVESENGVFLGYATATDADDPLGEGSYFAWPSSELEKVLSLEDAAWLAERWNISGDGQLPDAESHGEYEPVASWIPHPRGAEGYPENYRNSNNKDSRREASLILTLRAARQSRPAPSLDNKVLTDQNALLLEGFSRLARYGGGEQYKRAAVELAGVLINQTTAQLQRTPGIDAYITDYGYLAMALTQVYTLTGNPEYIDSAEKVAREAVKRLATGDGAYYSTPKEDNGLYKRAIEEFDGPSPAGQHALGIAFARLYNITGRSEWKENADNLLAARVYIGSVAPAATSTLVRLASMRNEPFTFVVAGPGGVPKTDELLVETRRLTGPDMMVVAADQAAETGVTDWVELEGRMGLEESQLLICREGSCLLPAFNLEEILVRLKQIGQGR
ncbi:MAG: thioredoxin domain-containing protein, partial [Spirochaetaceae bacterium]|nr:thioredoxin domain-containing protein [Spirochaetaceae bacterium]